jgi:predicted dehydrogenase
MVRIGIVGIGFMGWAHFSGAAKFTDAGRITGSKLKGGAVTTICSRSPEKLIGDWTSIQGNYGPRGVNLDLTKIVAYDNYREMFASPDIDLIDICLPNDQHEEVAIAALNAGKHVIIEKPIAVDLKAADRMVAVAKKTGRQLMVAQVLPFFPEFKFAADTIASGKYGKLLAANFRRVISTPKWSGDMSDFRKLGGWGIDLHIHDNHFISLICGVPQAVFSRGILQDGLVNHVHTQYVYDALPVAVTSVSGGIAAEGLAFSAGFEIYLERATLLYSAGTLAGEWTQDRPLTLVTGGKVTQPKLKGGGEWCSAFTAELQTAVDAVKSGVTPQLLSDELARDALKVCVAEAKSIATGKPVKIV